MNNKNNKNYFADCQTIEEIKKRYRELAQRYHPDHNRTNGVDTNQIMAEINSQYEKFRYQKFTSVNHETNKTYEQTFDPFDGYREIIDRLINLQGIQIELCGTWLWITGDTKQHKETLKELNFSFSSKKIAWYWKPGTYRKKSKRELNLEEIRNLYGSNRVNREDQQTEQRQAIAV